MRHKHKIFRGRNVFLPTQEEIQQECQKIQKSWSDRERQRRDCSTKPQRWSLPIVETDVLLYNISTLSDLGYN